MLSRRLSRFTCRLLLILFSTQTTGCHSWRVTSLPEPQAGEVTTPDRYRLTLKDGTRLHAQALRVSHDTLLARKRQAPNDSTGWMAIPISRVAGVEERSFSRWPR